MREIQLIKIHQPIGDFFIGHMSATDINSFADVKRLVEGRGIQRRLNTAKVKEITNYCEDPDAAFPTAIIIAVKTREENQLIESNGIWTFSYDIGKKTGEIIDGQHRINGIINSKHNIEMPVVLMFDITEEQKAYIFSTINSNQTKVDKSSIYELFELSEKRSPFKTCHDLARTFNSSVDSPFYKRLRMLGFKDGKIASLTQGSFVQGILKLITKNQNSANQDMLDIKNNKKILDDPKIPLRHYFIEEKDDIIYKILFNYFSAVKNTFTEEWNNPDNFILSKTTGFGALIKAFPMFYSKGVERKDLSENFFKSIFEKIKKDFEQNNITFTSEQFGSGEKEQDKLCSLLKKVLNEYDFA